MPDDPEKERLFELLREACEGLVYVSETDAPVLPVLLDRQGRSSSDVLPELVRKDADRRLVVESGAAEFFDRLTAAREWHGPRERDLARRFARLRGVMEEHLSAVKVYHVGDVRIDIFVLGETSDGRIAGVRTMAVET